MRKERSKSMSNSAPPELLLPEWLLPIKRVCAAIYPFILLVAGLCLVTLLAFIFIKRTDFPWLLNINGFFLFCASLGLITLLFAEYRSVIAGWSGIVAGMFFYHAPYFILMLVNQVGGDAKAIIVSRLMLSCKYFGILAVFLALFSLLFAYALLLINRERIRREARMQYAVDIPKQVEKPSLFPKCWQMSRCRPVVRVTCPNYIDHKTCWKRRSGCFCDKELANYLIGNSAKGESTEMIEMQKVAAVRPNMTGERRRWRDQKKLCYACPLFLEHQEYKYRRFSGISIILTIVLTGLLYPLYHIAYQTGMKSLDSILQGRFNIPGINVDTSLANSPFEWVLLAVLAMLLWSYLITFVDNYFLEWKL